MSDDSSEDDGMHPDWHNDEVDAPDLPEDDLKEEQNG